MLLAGLLARLGELKAAEVYIASIWLPPSDRGAQDEVMQLPARRCSAVCWHAGFL